MHVKSRQRNRLFFNTRSFADLCGSRSRSRGIFLRIIGGTRPPAIRLSEVEATLGNGVPNFHLLCLSNNFFSRRRKRSVSAEFSLSKRVQIIHLVLIACDFTIIPTPTLANVSAQLEASRPLVHRDAKSFAHRLGKQRRAVMYLDLLSSFH